jgi:hypothetical protein
MMPHLLLRFPKRMYGILICFYIIFSMYSHIRYEIHVRFATSQRCGINYGKNDNYLHLWLRQNTLIYGYSTVYTPVSLSTTIQPRYTSEMANKHFNAIQRGLNLALRCRRMIYAPLEMTVFDK